MLGTLEHIPLPIGIANNTFGLELPLQQHLHSVDLPGGDPHPVHGRTHLIHHAELPGPYPLQLLEGPLPPWLARPVRGRLRSLLHRGQHRAQALPHPLEQGVAEGAPGLGDQEGAEAAGPDFRDRGGGGGGDVLEGHQAPNVLCGLDGDGDPGGGVAKIGGAVRGGMAQKRRRASVRLPSQTLPALLPGHGHHAVQGRHSLGIPKLAGDLQRGLPTRSGGAGRGLGGQQHVNHLRRGALGSVVQGGPFPGVRRLHVDHAIGLGGQYPHATAMVRLGSDLQWGLASCVGAVDVETSIQGEQIPKLLDVPQMGRNKQVAPPISEPECRYQDDVGQEAQGRHG
mmetsp:Transcript_25286/g.64850  ORF Transcript_25286/g.64850 Transcript_25286/m.64850 type:complete len:340 (-) Transcript_25286:1189-2208(-)